MRDIGGALAGEVTQLAMCWKLWRRDGVALGFTSHDRDIVLDGMTYRSGPGMTPSAVSQGDLLRSDSMEIEGVLGSGAITGLDFEAGRWTGARVGLLVCDWSSPEAGFLWLAKGSVGEIAHPFPASEGAFRAELLSDGHGIERWAPVRLSPMCRSELGDGRCGVNMDARRIEVVLAAGGGGRLTMAAPLASPGDMDGGQLRFMSGPLSGVDRRIAAVEGADLVVEDPLPDVSFAGVRALVWEGCDKRFETCRSRFANAAAFNGEPHVPGTDALLRYAET